jgi:carbon storage regulator
VSAFFVSGHLSEMRRVIGGTAYPNADYQGGQLMLVLSRKQTESIVVGGSCGLTPVVVITVLGIVNGVVKLGFSAAADVSIHRSEVLDRIQAGAVVRAA